jgi:GMP synthase-like glutamine amidotransferase
MAMNVLFLKNCSVEGPGTIEDHLAGRGVPSTTVDLEAGEPLPQHDPFTHIVVLGGPMAVYEMDKVPYLRSEAKLIGEAVAEGKRVLGVCLGAQLLAHVLGGRVYPGGKQEIGWDEVTLTDQGMADPCMAELLLPGTKKAQVFQMHGDTFDLPPGSVLLASSGDYPNQAFRSGDRVYALQFHIEVTPSIVTGWLRNAKGIDLPLVDRRSQEIYQPYLTRAKGFYGRFFRQ